MSRKWEWGLLAGIVLLAGALRMGWPGLTEFKLDEARVTALALQLVELKALPLTATDMSVGLPNPPLTIYLYALPLWVWRSPLAPLLFGAALNTAAVALLYFMTRRYWGPRAALIAAALYASAPWAVLYSRKVWASNLLPLFLVGYVFSGLLALVEGRRRWIVVHVLLLAVIIQIHISSVALAPVTVILLILNWRRVDWRWAAAGAAGAMLLVAPFLWYLATRAGPVGGGVTLLAGRPLAVSADVAQLAFMVLAGTVTHSLAGPDAFRAFDASLPDLTLLFWIGGGLAALGAGRLAWSAWSAARQRGGSPADRAGLLILAWLAAPLLFFVAHLSPVYPHYLTVFFSIAFVLSGVALDWLLGRVRTTWPRAGLALLPLVIVLAQVWQLGALLRFVGMYSTPGAFGVPLGKLLQVAAAARDLGPRDILVVSRGVDTWNDETPAVFDILLHGQPHRFVDARTTAVLPAGEAVAVLWPDAPARTAELYSQWGGGRWAATLPLRQGEGEVHLTLSAGTALPVPRPRPASALLANGVEVLGSGGALPGWELWWRAPDGGSGEDVTVFAHLLDAGGQRVAQADVATYPLTAWRAGDLVVSYLPLNGAGTLVRAGLYGARSLAAIDVLDAAGNPAGPWLEFPLK